MSPAVGQLITETCDYDGGRQVAAYIPPAPPEAVIYVGDGQLIGSWAGELGPTGLPPVMLIGAYHAADEIQRIQEYSLGQSTDTSTFDPERFAAHEKFFTGERAGQCARAGDLPVPRILA